MRRHSRFDGLRRAFTMPRSARTVERDVADEIHFHLESRVAELIAQGRSPEAAREHASREYGDIVASRRELADVDRRRLARDHWTGWIDAFRQDLAFALRVFRVRPAFAVAAVLVFALGIGANATMFGLIDRLLLRPPAHVADPASVMMIRYLRHVRGEIDSQDALSFPMYLDLRNTPGAFHDVAVYTPEELAVGRGMTALRVSGARVTADYFRTLGVQPRVGRFFASDEDGAPTAPNVAVISYAFWQREFNGDAAAVGRAVPIGDAHFTIIGVAPAGFTGVTAEATDMWVPLTAGVTAKEYEAWTQSRNGFWLYGVARVTRGVTREAAAAGATSVLRASMRRDGVSEQRIADQLPAIGFISVLPREAHAGDVSARVAVLLGGVSLAVLLIACANVANLQLSRGISRRREIAIRVALGVSRARLLVQLLTESVVLAVAGGAGALLVANWGSSFVRRTLLGMTDLAGVSPIDGRVLAYTMVASIAVGILTGILPAMQAGRSSVTAELKVGIRDGGLRRMRARTALLLVQTVFSVLLLVGTGLFVKSLRRIDALPLGLDPSRALVATVQTTGVAYTGAELLALYQRFLETALASPGVDAAALATSLPFSSSWAVPIRVPGRDSLPRVRDGGPYMNEVTPRYFETMGTRLVQGRGFTAADHATAPHVVIVNESLARLWWPGESAIGKCMRVGGDSMPCSEIVGIVENSRRQSLIEDVSLQYFLPLAQPVPDQHTIPVLLIRVRGTPESAMDPLRRRLQTAAPNLPYVRVRPLADLTEPQKQSWRLGATMFSVFGVLSLLLAAVGMYSVLSYDVAQRTREFGVRVALGARGVAVMQMVLMQGMRTAAIGSAVGVALALLGGRALSRVLFQTSSRDPGVFAVVIVVVTGIAVIAALVPAWRALRVDPIVALRAE